jgi:HSP20 family protein
MAKEPKSNLPGFWGRDPFSNFRKEFDELVDNLFSGKALEFPKMEMKTSLPEGVLRPSVDIKENDKAVTMTAELPGLVEDDVDVSVREGVLTLKGEKKMEETREDEDVHVMERQYGSFQRSISLPDRVDAEAIKAKFANGVLTVTMPKKAEAKSSTRKIPVGKK